MHEAIQAYGFQQVFVSRSSQEFLALEHNHMQLTSLQRERLRGFLGYLQLQEETGLVILEDEKLLPTLKKELQHDEMVEARNSDEVVRMLKRKTSPFIVLTNENAQELSALERYIKSVTFNRNEIIIVIGRIGDALLQRSILYCCRYRLSV